MFNSVNPWLWFGYLQNWCSTSILTLRQKCQYVHWLRRCCAVMSQFKHMPIRTGGCLPDDALHCIASLWILVAWKQRDSVMLCKMWIYVAHPRHSLWCAAYISTLRRGMFWENNVIRSCNSCSLTSTKWLEYYICETVYQAAAYSQLTLQV